MPLLNGMKRLMFVSQTQKKGFQVLLLLFAIVCLLYGFFVPVKWENPPVLFGTRDMIAFWAGTNGFLARWKPVFVL
jgi:hypothetical protein